MSHLSKYAGRLFTSIFAAAVCAIFLIVPKPAWSAWETGVLDSEGSVGSYAEVQRDASGNIHVVYYRSDTGVFRVLSRLYGVWQSPEEPDVSGGVSGDCAIAVDDTGARRVSYRRGNALWYAGPEGTLAWEKGVVFSSPDNVGPFLSLRNAPDGELSLSCRNVTQGSLILLMRDVGGAWSPPVTVDPGPNRGFDSDHAYRPGVGYAFSERGGPGATLLLADPIIRSQTWSTGVAFSSPDNVGPFLSLRNAPDGELSLSCRNVTQGSLLLLMRDAFGAWASPVTVDPGPNRGFDSDHAYRPGVGYAFSERGGPGAPLLFADAFIKTDSWSKGTIYEGGENGPYVSLKRLPVGDAVVCTFYHYDDTFLGAVYNTFLHGLSRSTVTVVVDSIANGPADDVFVDVDVSSGLEFGISYRNAREPALCCATADSSIIVAIGNPMDPQTYVLRAQLFQNAPNPFNPSTRIRYEVPAGGGKVSIRIFDVAGRLVKTLVDGNVTHGRKIAVWDGRNESGEEVASGVYFCRMQAPGFTKTVKVTLVR